MSKSIVSWIGCASDVRKVTRVLFHRHEVCQPRGNLMNIEQSSENARPKQRHDGEADSWPLQWRCRHLWRWYCQHRNSDEQPEHLSNCQICIKNFFAKKISTKSRKIRYCYFSEICFGPPDQNIGSGKYKKLNHMFPPHFLSFLLFLLLLHF